MKTPTAHNHIFFALFSMLALAGCRMQDETLLPATANEIAQADISIFQGSELIGRGVLVGLNRDGKDRVFFLTARHVVTYGNISESDVTLLFGNGFKWSVRTQKDRWMTTTERHDSAWYELNDDEKSVLIEKNGLRYIPLESTLSAPRGGMMRGTGIVKLLDRATKNPSEQLPARMFFSAGSLDGTIDVGKGGTAPMPFPYNQVFKTGHIFIVPVRASRLSLAGDSGGPLFAYLTIDGQTYQLLAGLVIGANNILNINALQPIDEVCNEIVNSSRRLIDSPELW